MIFFNFRAAIKGSRREVAVGTKGRKKVVL